MDSTASPFCVTVALAPAGKLLSTRWAMNFKVLRLGFQMGHRDKKGMFK